VGGATPNAIAKMASSEHVQAELLPLKPAHMPVLFPEVFLRDNAGFDVLLGNPPWKEVVPDEPRFWMMVRPGIRSLAGDAREHEIQRLKRDHPDLAERFDSECRELETIRGVLKATFDMGSGDADLSRAFAWRCWQLNRRDGRIGIVLPKTAFSAEGLELFRRTVLTEGGIESVVFCANTKKWLFDIEARYSVAIAVLSKSKLSEIACSGPFTNYGDFETGRNNFARFPTEVVLSMTESASIPVISSQVDADIMVTMRKSPSFSTVVGSDTPFVSELHATNDKKFFYKPDAQDPVKVYSGKSFGFWNSDTGDVFAIGSHKILKNELHRKFAKQKTIKSTAYFGWSDEDSEGKIPFERFRVAFAGVSRGTDARTSMAALITPEVALTNICPYIAVKAGNEKLEAFLLGVMNSRIFDWYARKFIETQMNLFFVKAFPVPAFDERETVKKITQISAGLTCTSGVFAEWATKVEVECREITVDERENLIVQLDAYVAKAYGLNAQKISRIMESFHEPWAYKPHLQKVLAAFELIEDGDS
jgi:hypothetical protein